MLTLRSLDVSAISAGKLPGVVALLTCVDDDAAAVLGASRDLLSLGITGFLFSLIMPIGSPLCPEPTSTGEDISWVEGEVVLCGWYGSTAPAVPEPLRRFRRMHKKANTVATTPARAPMTIPAIAPPEIPEEP